LLRLVVELMAMDVTMINLRYYDEPQLDITRCSAITERPRCVR